MVDELTAVFGPVKVRWCEEAGKAMGKPLPFDGTDIDKLIRLDDMDAKRRGVGR